MNNHENPTLIFFLSSFRGFNTGVGGHYRSVLEVSRALSTNFDVHVLTFGNIPSSVFSGLPEYTHVNSNSSLNPMALRKLRAVIKSIAARSGSGNLLRIVSTGLNNDYAPIRLATLCMGARYFHVKPGGKPAAVPRVFNGIPLAVFHEDDLRAFQEVDPGRMVVMTPGRVTPPPLDPSFLEIAKSPVFRNGLVNVVCVMRISAYYRNSIAMIHQALTDTSNITFTHIGAIQDADLHRNISQASPGCEYALITTPDVTKAAAKAIHPFQAFVGLGRSAIEAMSLGIPTFVPVPVSESDCKLLAVTKTNWDVFARANFTARVKHADLEDAGEIIELADISHDRDKLRELGNEAREIFAHNFSPESSKETWISFLSQASYSGGLYDVLRGALLLRSELKRALLLLRPNANVTATTREP